MIRQLDDSVVVDQQNGIGGGFDESLKEFKASFEHFGGMGPLLEFAHQSTVLFAELVDEPLCLMLEVQ